MIRTLILIASVTSIAGSALAADITVKVAGRDEAAVKADIRKAALKVCREVYAGSIMAIPSERACIRQVVIQTHRKLELARASQPPALDQYAAAK